MPRRDFYSSSESLDSKSRKSSQSKPKNLTSTFTFIKSFIKIARIKFLPHSFLLSLLGALSSTKSLNYYALAHTVTFAMTVHVMTHLSNDYYDYETDLLNEQRSKWNGGSGVLLNGSLSRMVVGRVMFGMLFGILGSLFASAYFDPHSPFKGYSLVLSLAIIGLAWGYTAPPLRFQYRGLGELTVALTMSVMLTALSCMMQTNGHLTNTFSTIVPLLFIQNFSRMMIMNLPDVESDLKCGKNTLTSQVGVETTKEIYGAAQVVLTIAPLVMYFMNYMHPAVCIGFLLAAMRGWQANIAIQSADMKHISKAENKKNLPFMATMHVLFTVFVVVVALVFMRAENVFDSHLNRIDSSNTTTLIH
ncbi:hypothetical protein HK098_000698 [Nowakowskiella sp. JEL0407]|nr:hypothetical protein HK098_000698 [Nowakowskiella sp. JEL0407]